MLLYRKKVRTEVLEINDQNSLEPWEKVEFGIRVALSERESAILRREEEQEREFVENSKLLNKYIVYIRARCTEVFSEHKGGKMLMLLDREVEPVLPLILKNKNLRGYKLEVGYIDSIALATRKKVRIPLYIEDSVS